MHGAIGCSKVSKPQGLGGSDRRRSDPDLDPIFAGSDRIPIQFCKLGSERIGSAIFPL